MEQKPANTGLRSQYALRLYSWAKKYVTDRTKSVSLEQFRKVLGLESVKVQFPWHRSSVNALFIDVKLSGDVFRVSIRNVGHRFSFVS